MVLSALLDKGQSPQHLIGLHFNKIAEESSSNNDCQFISDTSPTLYTHIITLLSSNFFLCPVFMILTAINFCCPSPWGLG